MPMRFSLDLLFGTLASPFHRCCDLLGLPLNLAGTDQRGRGKHSLTPLHFNNTGSANVCANLKEPDKLSTLLRCHNAVDSPLTEGKQVPLPQSTNDPIISIRSHDWCYTPLLLLSSSPHIQAPPKSHLDWGLRAPSSTVEPAEGGGVDCGRGFEVWMKTIRPFYAKPGFSFISTLGSHWKAPY